MDIYCLVKRPLRFTKQLRGDILQMLVALASRPAFFCTKPYRKFKNFSKNESEVIIYIVDKLFSVSHLRAIDNDFLLNLFFLYFLEINPSFSGMLQCPFFSSLRK